VAHVMKVYGHITIVSINLPIILESASERSH
jgi:hypothetical protein